MLGVELRDHVRGIGIIPQIPLVSAPAVVSPVLPVLDDEIHGNLVRAKLTGRRQHLRLARITFPALPETIRRLGKQRRFARGLTVAGDDFIGGRAVKKVVINRIADLRTKRRRVAQRARKNFRVSSAAEQSHRASAVGRQCGLRAQRVSHPHVRDGGDGLSVDLNADEIAAISIFDEKDIIPRSGGGKRARFVGQDHLCVSGIEVCERGIVPEQTITVTRNNHRQGDFGVQLPKLLRHSSPVPNAFLKLAESVDEFIGWTVEDLLRLIGHLAIHGHQGHGLAAVSRFRQQEFV